MDRRSFLIGAATGVVGVGGWQYRDRIGEVINGSLGTPETENPIKNVGGDGFLNRFTLYESGAAQFEFGDDYGCYERIAVGDSSNLRVENLGVWDLPSDGKLIVDMQGTVSKTKDPSNEFWLESLSGKDSVCLGITGVDRTFTVPEDWVN